MLRCIALAIHGRRTRNQPESCWQQQKKAGSVSGNVGRDPKWFGIQINDPAKDTLPNIQNHQQTDRTETVCLGKQGISRKSAGNSRKKAGSVPGKQAVAD
jgi:hypothetical protein